MLRRWSGEASHAFMTDDAVGNPYAMLSARECLDPAVRDHWSQVRPSSDSCSNHPSWAMSLACPWAAFCSFELAFSGLQCAAFLALFVRCSTEARRSAVLVDACAAGAATPRSTEVASAGTETSRTERV